MIGIVGTVWSVYSSFAALDTAEFGGIGSVGDQLRNALLFSIGGLLGCAVGALLIVVRRAKADSNNESAIDDINHGSDVR